MAITESLNVQRPGQSNSAGAVNALHIEEFSTAVEGTIKRKSAISGFVPMKAVKGTSILTNFAVGRSTLQKATPGVVPDGTTTDFAKRSLAVDTVVLARAILPLLEVFQTSYDARQEIGVEHGKEIAKMFDQTFFIQAIKAGLMTDSAFRGAGAAGKPLGHFGGSQFVLGAAGDRLDPARLYASLASLYTAMELKDVSPQDDDVVLAVKPTEFYTLMQAEQLISSTYKTADGTSVEGMVLKGYGCPVIRSNNFPGGETITGHMLSNAANSNAYDGDFTRIVGCAFSPKALMAGETIPLTTEVFYDNLSKSWFVDAHLSFAVGPNRAEYAGVIQLP